MKTEHKHQSILIAVDSTGVGRVLAAIGAGVLKAIEDSGTTLEDLDWDDESYHVEFGLHVWDGTLIDTIEEDEDFGTLYLMVWEGSLRRATVQDLATFDIFLEP